jgi:transcriptional regulator with XRE-family HTH domain
MRTSDLVRIARHRAGLTQKQLASRSGIPRETIARWETGIQEPSLSTLEDVVAACGLTLTVRITEGDDSLDILVSDQMALSPIDRLGKLMPADQAARTQHVLNWLALARTPIIVVGGFAAALQGAPQQPGDLGVEVVAGDLVALTSELADSGFAPTDSDERWAARDRRWPWSSRDGGEIVLASGLPGSRDYPDLRRNAVAVEIGDGRRVRVAHPRDLVRLAEASPRAPEQARLPGLRALLSAENTADD